MFLGAMFMGYDPKKARQENKKPNVTISNEVFHGVSLGLSFCDRVKVTRGSRRCCGQRRYD